MLRYRSPACTEACLHSHRLADAAMYAFASPARGNCCGARARTRLPWHRQTRSPAPEITPAWCLARLVVMHWLQGAVDACKIGCTIAIRYSADRPQVCTCCCFRRRLAAAGALLLPASGVCTPARAPMAWVPQSRWCLRPGPPSVAHHAPTRDAPSLSSLLAPGRSLATAPSCRTSRTSAACLWGWQPPTVRGGGEGGGEGGWKANGLPAALPGPPSASASWAAGSPLQCSGALLRGMPAWLPC